MQVFDCIDDLSSILLHFGYFEPFLFQYKLVQTLNQVRTYLVGAQLQKYVHIVVVLKTVVDLYYILMMQSLMQFYLVLQLS